MIDSEVKTRLGIVFFGFALLYGIIMINVASVAIWHHSFFVHLGQKQYQTTHTFKPPRATIFDRSGAPLAINKDRLAAFITPSKLEQRTAVHKFLATHFPQALERLVAQHDTQFMYITRNLSPEQIELITQVNLPDIKILKEPSRFYPLLSAASIVGFTDIDNNGLCGVELYKNNVLSGVPQVCALEKDARSGYFHFKKETKISGKESEPIALTIDSDLQFLVAQEVAQAVTLYQAKLGLAIIMDPTNGHILSMVTIPSFDPHNYQSTDPELSKNRVVSDAYELGSVIKVFAALAALEEGVVTADELIDCKNTKTTYIDGRKINTVHPCGLVPFADVIAKSNNIGTAIVAKRLGPKLYNYYIRLGFGQKTGIELPGEHKGFVNPPEAWSKQSIISLSYGYEITATVIQLARAMSIIANDGYDVIPTISNSTESHSPNRLFKQEPIEIIQQLLEQTTLVGTAKKAAIKGYKVMSKTGTTNLLVNGQYDSNKNMYTCSGIVQKGTYKRVIVCLIKESPQGGLYASTVAAPLFEKIAQRMLIHDKII